MIIIMTNNEIQDGIKSQRQLWPMKTLPHNCDYDTDLIMTHKSTQTERKLSSTTCPSITGQMKVRALMTTPNNVPCGMKWPANRKPYIAQRSSCCLQQMRLQCWNWNYLVIRRVFLLFSFALWSDDERRPQGRHSCLTYCWLYTMAMTVTTCSHNLLFLNCHRSKLTLTAVLSTSFGMQWLLEALKDVCTAPNWQHWSCWPSWWH